MANYGLWVKSRPLTIVNKILLEHNQDHSFTYHLWLLSCYNAKLNSCNTEQVVHKVWYIYYLIFGFFVFVFVSLGLHPGHMEVPRLGVPVELQLPPTPQPQQYRIQATYATYTTANGNAGSLIHWARPGIEPATSWFLAKLISAEI